MRKNFWTRKLVVLSAALATCAIGSVADAGYVETILADPGLVSYWRFEEEITPGGETVDSNNNANPGFYADDGGVTGAPGIIGQAAAFDGEPLQVIEIENEENFDFTDQMSVEAWFKTDGAFTKNWQAIVNKGDDQWRLHRRSGECGLAFGRDEDGTNNRDTLDSGVCVDDEEWHHAVAVFDNVNENEDLRTSYLYVDGELIITGSNDGENEPPLGDLNTEVGANIDLPVMIGGNAQDVNGGYRSFFGLIDEVSVYNRALTEADVALRYQLGLNDPGGNGGTAGDFDNDGDLDIDDINALLSAVKSAGVDAKFDVDGSGGVDAGDIKFWAETLKNSYVGDANLDLEFNSGDFVATFTAGLYETGQAANWGQGDWNGDGQFNSSDFVAAFSGGGYELGPRAATAAVPEPSSVVLLLIGLLGLARSRR